MPAQCFEPTVDRLGESVRGPVLEVGQHISPALRQGTPSWSESVETVQDTGAGRSINLLSLVLSRPRSVSA
ncbi:hypothetical protein NJ76_28445 [Rhodococcus sp. IITR03]|nr:hypothetical protein NJ76_28445 [Rhodococcus sp. IITR03]